MTGSGAVRKKSVAIIGTRGYPSYYGGFETAVRKLAPYLAEQGWDVTVYGRHGSTKAEDGERDSRVHTKVTWGVETKSVSTLSYGLSATLDAARVKPDVALVMNCANGYWLPILRARGIPTLVNVDGIEWERDKWGKLAKTIFHTGARLTARFGDELVYDAKEIQRRWKDQFKRDGTWIPYGGELEPELPVEPGLETRRYALAVARFVPENTIPEFLTAAETLAETHDVVLVGSSGYGGELDRRAEELAKKLPRFHWFGHVSDDKRLHSLWQHAGAYFHGHSVGGTNPALVQAMTSGAPIVARDTVYNREVLAETAVFTTPDPTQISRAIAALLSDAETQSELSAQTARRAAEHYTWEGVCGAYSDALLQLIEGKRSKKQVPERNDERTLHQLSAEGHA
jgi:glycosyltransferase involved in cell wall biosynthesis